MARKLKAKLPPEPTGYELYDLAWAHYSYLAPVVLDTLPHDADPVWATVTGVQDYAAVIRALDQARAELERTSETSPIRRLRERQVRRLDRRSRECSELICAALAGAARAAHRRASPKQIWTLVFEGLKSLLTDFVGSPEPGSPPSGQSGRRSG
jgi:hypothetical protein